MQKADRATGAFFLCFGAFLYFVIIPAQVSDADGSWILPSSIPNATAMVMGLCGTLLMLFPTTQQYQNPTDMIFAVVYFVLLLLGLWLMSYVGFVYAAPVISLVIMIMIGERRPFWILVGVAGLPTFIWIFVGQILERSLP